MEHKGIHYQVVQTTHPTGFKWTVELQDGRTKTGGSLSRPMAIRLAMIAIDRALEASSKVPRDA
jgi:hypothetical protein